jgi:O-antigen/teichoic acid export membrane protein
MSIRKSWGSKNFNALLIMALRGSALVSKFALTLFIAKYLGIEAVGYYGYLAGAAAILPLVLGFGLMQEFGRRLVVEGLPAIRLPLLTYWQIVVIVYAAVTALSIPVSQALGLGLKPRVLLLAGTVLLFEHLNNDSFFIVSNLKRPVFANFQVFLRAAAWIIVYMPLALFYGDLRTLDSMLAFWAGGIVVSFLIFLLGCAKQMRPKAPHLGNTPTGIVMLAYRAKSIYAGEAVNALGVYLDRYLIGALLGTKAAGIYVVFSSLGLGLYNLVNTGVMQVLRPYLIEHHAKGDDISFGRVQADCMKRSLASTVTLSLCCGLAFHFLLPRLGHPELASQEHLLWLLLAGIAVRIASDVQGYVFYTRKQDFKFFATACVAPVAFVVLGILLIPVLGLTGGVISFIGAYATTLLVRTRLIRKTEGYQF